MCKKAGDSHHLRGNEKSGDSHHLRGNEKRTRELTLVLICY